MIYGYTRISKERNLIQGKELNPQEQTQRQIDLLVDYGVPPAYIWDEGICSGLAKNKPRQRQMLNYLKQGDTLVITELNRLSRDITQLEEIVAELQSKGVRLIVLDFPDLNQLSLDSAESWLVSKLLLSVMMYFARKERDRISERTKEGIETARRAGVHIGRPTPNIEVFDIYAQKYLDGEVTRADVEKILKIRKTTFFKYLQKYKVKKGIIPKL